MRTLATVILMTVIGSMSVSGQSRSETIASCKDGTESCQVKKTTYEGGREMKYLYLRFEDQYSQMESLMLYKPERVSKFRDILQDAVNTTVTGEDQMSWDGGGYSLSKFSSGTYVIGVRDGIYLTGTISESLLRNIIKMINENETFFN